MDIQSQPSFIPKKPIGTANVHSSGSWLGVFFFLITILVFLASMTGAGGAFLYEKYLNQSIVDKSDTLQKTEAAFDPTTIRDLMRLDSRITNAQSLLNKHVTVLGVFNFLSQETLQSVQFTGFTYSLPDSGIPQITLSGVADGFATVALQSDRFGSDPLLKNVVFSGIGSSQDGHVSFTVRADVDPTLVNYAKNLSASAAYAPPPVTPALAPTATSTPSGGTSTPNTQ